MSGKGGITPLEKVTQMNSLLFDFENNDKKCTYIKLAKKLQVGDKK